LAIKPRTIVAMGACLANWAMSVSNDMDRPP
jgi:hypothetical protein